MTSTRTLQAAKKLVRKDIRMRINKLTAAQKEEQSIAITNKLLSLDCYKSCNSLSVYLSMPTEVYTNQILQDIFKRRKKCYIPHYIGETMSMVRLKDQDDYDNLPLTSWNIKQPSDNEVRACAIDDGGLDLIIVPGLAFTTNGLRLGRGKGYYDTYFTRYKERFGKQPYLIGLAYDCQLLEELPVDEYDIQLDCVLHPTY